MAGQPTTKFDVGGIAETIRNALASAGLDARTGSMKGVTDTIEQALSAAGLMQRGEAQKARGMTVDSTAREIDLPTSTDSRIDAREPEPAESAVEPKPVLRVPRSGEFLDCSFAGAAGARDYKVYLPAAHTVYGEARVPMVVMLHGCTQSTDDFATGTKMNSLADTHGFIVVYPAQCAKANLQKCWNWFRTQDQARESGEPAIIAGITREVAARYGVDPQRIYVAGMSAGAAMAVILGATYPELYAAVGAHSGLAYAAAHDMPSAFGAMHRGGSIGAAINPRVAVSPPKAFTGVPTIVFHGDRDHTVSARNALDIVEQVTARPDAPALRATFQSGISQGGRAYSRTNYMDSENRSVAEHWVLHGAGHAWSGGNAAGSFTDSSGPDASAEMIRFFYLQRAFAAAK